eukprot:366196-Chlamydomonas_euryale.AAC.13
MQHTIWFAPVVRWGDRLPAWWWKGGLRPGGEAGVLASRRPARGGGRGPGPRWSATACCNT